MTQSNKHENNITADYEFNNNNNGGIFFTVALVCSLFFLLASIVGFISDIPLIVPMVTTIFTIISSVLLFGSFAVINPNEAYVISFLGKYKGTYSKQGFSLFNPFYRTEKVSVALNTLATKESKINDKDGTPLLVSMIVNWKVVEPGKYFYNSEKRLELIENSCETVLRHIVSNHYYESSEESEETLSKMSASFSETIISQLNKELAIIGVYVENANISNISYATEIAAAMLQRQQAKKTGESRKEIVNAAVNTVVDAISQLEEKTNVKFSDEEKKEATVKLMLVICSDQQVTPTINIGQ